MSNYISSIRETVTSGFNWAATTATQVASAAKQGATRVCSYIGPTLQTLVDKVKNVQLGAWAESVKTFFKSDTGIACAGVSIGIACGVGAQKVESTWARFLLWGLGVTSVVYSAARLLKPGLTVFGVKV